MLSQLQAGIDVACAVRRERSSGYHPHDNVPVKRWRKILKDLGIMLYAAALGEL
jgi:hypothetical protein